MDDLQTVTTHDAGDFDQLLNDDTALLNFMVSTNILLAKDLHSRYFYVSKIILAENKQVNNKAAISNYQ